MAVKTHGGVSSMGFPLPPNARTRASKQASMEIRCREIQRLAFIRPRLSGTSVHPETVHPELLAVKRQYWCATRSVRAARDINVCHVFRLRMEKCISGEPTSSSSTEEQLARVMSYLALLFSPRQLSTRSHQARAEIPLGFAWRQT